MNKWTRISEYYAGHGECKLAVDVYLPECCDKGEKVPAVMHTGYNPAEKHISLMRNL